MRVPSLILQPLVENAIQHGIAASARAGALTDPRSAVKPAFWSCEVRDTGPGMSRESAGNGRGIGLANTRVRLQRLYGDARSSSCPKKTASS